MIKSTPMPHQLEAFEKLKKIKVGALYMEMGTGKTLVTLMLAQYRLDMGKIDLIIWLYPNSIKYDLMKNIRKHSDLIEENKIIFCGIKTLSTSIGENEKLLRLVKENKVFLVIDESDLVKNPMAYRTINITRISKKARYKIILNGTPVTRNEADLFAQWYVLDWRILGYRSFWSFSANHLIYDEYENRVVNVLNVDYLTRKIEPYTYSCTLGEVVDLPEKRYSFREGYLTYEQREHYSYVVDVLINNINEVKPETIYQFFSALQAVVSGFEVIIKQTERGKIYTKRKPFFENKEDNPRLWELGRMLDGEKDKVIIFCKFTEEISWIVDMLNNEKEGCAARYDGSLNKNEKGKILNDFEEGLQFLVTNKESGAYGLNLQFCNKIIYYSHDWNWGTRKQSEDRVYRIGQQKEVRITDIYMYKTIDDAIIECLQKKENLADSFSSDLESVTKDKLKKIARGEI